MPRTLGKILSRASPARQSLDSSSRERRLELHLPLERRGHGERRGVARAPDVLHVTNALVWPLSIFHGLRGAARGAPVSHRVPVKWAARRHRRTPDVRRGHVIAVGAGRPVPLPEDRTSRRGVGTPLAGPVEQVRLDLRLVPPAFATSAQLRPATGDRRRAVGLVS